LIRASIQCLISTPPPCPSHYSQAEGRTGGMLCLLVTPAPDPQAIIQHTCCLHFLKAAPTNCATELPGQLPFTATTHSWSVLYSPCLPLHREGKECQGHRNSGS
jgi:hypothetical protein